MSIIYLIEMKLLPPLCLISKMNSYFMIDFRYETVQDISRILDLIKFLDVDYTAPLIKTSSSK